MRGLVFIKTLVFVPGALKGEEVFCQVTAVKRNFAEARLLVINKASKSRVKPACSIYETCGAVKSCIWPILSSSTLRMTSFGRP